MEQNRIDTASSTPADPPAFIPTMVSGSLNDTFARPEPQPRRIRFDGWTPERQAIFLDALAACGVVCDSAKRAGMSPQSAYAFRNRRAGRAFATSWDAVLINRARGRLSDELLSRAMNGCVEAVHRDGEIVGERHRYDNRLSMAVLTRLDRLAEQAGDRADHLRAVSEDLDELLDCLEAGGDAEAFVEARRPAPPPEPAPQPASAPAPEAASTPAPAAAQRNGDDWAELAALVGCDYPHRDPLDIDISDLPGRDLGGASVDQYLRAHYSGYLVWLELCRAARQELEADGPLTPEEEAELDAQATPAGFLERLIASRAAAEPDQVEPEQAPQPSASSTYPAEPPGQGD